MINKLTKECLLSEEVQEEIGRGLGLIKDTAAARQVGSLLMYCCVNKYFGLGGCSINGTYCMLSFRSVLHSTNNAHIRVLIWTKKLKLQGEILKISCLIISTFVNI